MQIKRKRWKSFNRRPFFCRFQRHKSIFTVHYKVELQLYTDQFSNDIWILRKILFFLSAKAIIKRNEGPNYCEIAWIHIKSPRMLNQWGLFSIFVNPSHKDLKTHIIWCIRRILNKFFRCFFWGLNLKKNKIVKRFCCFALFFFSLFWNTRLITRKFVPKLK